MKQIKIDESKIVKGQMPYVIKLMKLAKEQGYQEGLKQRVIGYVSKDKVKQIIKYLEDNNLICKVENQCVICKEFRKIIK